MNVQFDLRNLVPGERPEGIRCCGICGKPEATASKAVKDLPHHKAAYEADLPSQFRMLTKALGEQFLDFARREKFNAQLESIRAKLVAAREEHDAYTPPAKEEAPKTDKAPRAPRVKSDAADLVLMLGKTLALVGVKAEGSALSLATRLHDELSRLMEIKAEVEAQTSVHDNPEREKETA